MSIALPGNRGLFNHMQEALRQVEGKRLALTSGFHQALADFQWLVEYLIRCPTRLYELVPLHSTLDGYPDASGYMCGGSVLLGPTAVPWIPQPHPSAATTSLEPIGVHSIVWHAHFAADIIAQLVSWVNLEVQITSSYL